MVTSAAAGAGKPDPAIFEFALEAAGCRAAQALHVGDSLEEDVTGARAAGIEVVWLNRARSRRRAAPAGVADDLEPGRAQPSDAWTVGAPNLHSDDAATPPPSPAQPPAPAPAPEAGPPSPAPVPRGSGDVPPWSVWMAPAAVVLGLALGTLGSLVVELIGEAGGSTVSHPTPAVSIIADIVFDLGFVVAALYLCTLRGRRARGRLRLPARRVSVRR